MRAAAANACAIVANGASPLFIKCMKMHRSRPRLMTELFQCINVLCHMPSVRSAFVRDDIINSMGPVLESNFTSGEGGAVRACIAALFTLSCDKGLFSGHTLFLSPPPSLVRKMVG